VFVLYTIVRLTVIAAFSLALLVALAAWAVRSRRVSPFGGLGRTLRSISEPVLAPVERVLVRTGGSPRHAGWWLVIGAAITGVVVLTLVQWLGTTFAEIVGAVDAGPIGVARLCVALAYEVLVAALVVRVVGSWLAAFRYARSMRVAYALTDWLVEPLRRVLPPVGVFDWSPLAAWIVLWILKAFLLAVL
jgi:YggT family protein